VVLDDVDAQKGEDLIVGSGCAALLDGVAGAIGADPEDKVTPCLIRQKHLSYCVDIVLQICVHRNNDIG